MDFGRLNNVNKIDFFLPDDALQNKTILGKYKNKSDNVENNSENNLNEFPKIYVGCPVWSNKEWRNKIYPSNAKTEDFLKYYSSQFNAIELNTTHYNPADEATIQKWKALASQKDSRKDFKFCPKFPQPISHERIFLKKAKMLSDSFCETISSFGENLGLSFLQLPPTFEPRHLDLLAYFLEDFPTNIPLSIEFRHADWFRNDSFSKATDLLEKYNISTVITDVAGRRDVLHQTLTNDKIMVRFVGNTTTTDTKNLLHPTDYTRIDAWVKCLSVWIEQGLREIYFFCHEPNDNISSPELAVYFIKELNLSLKKNLKFSLLPPYIRNTDTQGSLF